MTTKLNREIAVRKFFRCSKTDPRKINYLGRVKINFAMGFATGIKPHTEPPRRQTMFRITSRGTFGLSAAISSMRRSI
jgi:hypothetical protein